MFVAILVIGAVIIGVIMGAALIYAAVCVAIMKGLGW